jgi:ABC-type antimicrobial peptide transport system permease subunit
MTTLHTWFQPNWIVRVNGSPEGVIRGIRDITTTLDPLLPIAGFRTIDELRSHAVAQRRFQATLLGTLSGLALVLAVVGIYGLMAQSVMARRRELGIRLALGSSIAGAIGDAARPGMVLAGAGVAIGCVLAALSARVLEHLVWGVSTTDAVTYASVAVGLLLISALASLIPALRIARLNPADTLREE